MKKILITILITTLFLPFINSQVIVPFTQRSSVNTPNKYIYNVRGDFTLIGNTNLTLANYGDNTGNHNNMIYVDVDADPNTLNSSSATLQFSTENGAIPECSNIIFAGLYWTGRAHDGGTSPMEFNVTKNSVTVNFNKRQVLLRGPGAGGYTVITANQNDIYFPETQHGQMYSAFAEITDYVKQYGLGEYTVANIALREGVGGGTGYYGGWGLIVIYENSKMKWRDITIFDGHAYVAGGITADFTIPVSGFNTVQSGQVNMKLGLVAGEGDRPIQGDYFQIRDHSNTNWITLNHAGNSTNNFFNSSIFTGGNPRNPNLLNNTGLDISMFNIPNSGNSVITNNQTSTQFRYGTTQDTYVIFMMAMSVDAYIPTPEAHAQIQSINNLPYTPGDPLVIEPGQEIEITIDIRNKGTEPIDNAEVIVPIPFASTYVSSSNQIYFSPSPNPNNLYFDPTLGANGSIVWQIGTLPLPADPNELLGKLTFKIKATEDCTILANTNCDAQIVVQGHMNGVGQISGTLLNNLVTVQGFQTSGLCIGEPILNPFIFSINSTNFVNDNCSSSSTNLQFLLCNLTGPSIPITQILGHFPPGSRFYNQYPVTTSTIEYTINNPFPATLGTTTYYAVPPGTTSCYFEFTIQVLDFTSTPTVTSPVVYCQNQTANPLTATPGDPSYLLYYYYNINGIPQTSITPSTATVGTFTYYVAEALSSSCISPNKVPIQVIVNPLPEAPTAVSSSHTSVCFNETGNITLTATGGSGTTLNWYTGSCQGTLIGTGNNLSITAPTSTTTYYVAWQNSCGISDCAEVTVTVLPEIIVNLTITSEIAYYNGNTGEITVTATGGTPSYSYSLNGGPFGPSNVFSNLYPGNYTVVVMDSEGCTVSSTITINNASQIIANDDFGTINGYTGGTAVVNVLSNDLLNGNPVDPADVILTFISSTDPNISLVGQDVVVAPGTPAGTYYLVYQICELANPTNCDQATVTITVIPPQIIANDDFASGINGSTGQNNVLNVFDNDLLNGNPVDPAEVSLTLTVPDPTNTLTLNPDGSVDVAPFTPGGTYTLTYQICEILNPANCDDAIVTIVVINTSDVSIVKSHIDPSNLPVGNPSQLIQINPSVITAGTMIYYFLNVQNLGPNNSLQATITDITPPGILNPEYSLNFGNSWFSWAGTRYLNEFLYPGANYVLIRGFVDPAATGTLLNTATIYSAVTPDSDLSNNLSTVVTTILTSADLEINKITLSAPVTIGGQIIYQISVTNYGPSNANNVTITDIIDPTIISSVEYSVDGGINWLSPWTGSLNIGTLAYNSSFVFLIRGTVVDASPNPNVDPIPNTASVTSSDPDPNPGNNEETILTPLNFEADVSILKTGPSTIVAGTQIQYSILVTNNSNTFDALNVHIYDNINPLIIDNPEFSVDGGLTWNPWTGIYVIGDMNPLTSVTILIRGNVLSNITGSILNTAYVQTDTPDPDVTNNTSTVNTTVEVVSDLYIYKVQIDPSILPLSDSQIFGNPNDIVIDPVTITAGETIYYAILYGNNGPSDATNVMIQDILPGVVVDWESSRCQANYGTWTGVGNLGTIIAGGGCVLIIRGDVLPDATGSIVNTATINSNDVTDPDPDNNESTFITPIQGLSDLSVQKTVDNNTPYVGDQVTFTITITNNGPSQATNISVTDQLPTGYTYVSHTVSAGSYDNVSGIWTISSIDYPGFAVLTITAIVNLPGGNNTNVATITDFDQHDPNPDDNTDSETTNPVNVIIANDDNAGPINGYTGAVNILNVFDNDLLNGSPVNPADLILTEVIPDPTGNLTLNPDGSVDLAPNTPAGTYTLTYQICEIINPSNCDDAIVTVTVLMPSITANNDTFTAVNFDCVNGGIVGNVLDNDLYNGNPANPSNVIITLIDDGGISGANILANGNLYVPAGTVVGTYNLSYQICDVINPTNCDDADIVVIIQDFIPPTITCPDDITSYTDTDDCQSTSVVIVPPTVDDNCGILSVSGMRSDLLALTDPYPVGATTITWTVTDFGGNTATCEQTVTVIDNQLPDITCPTPVTAYTDADECFASGIVLGSPVVDDNCGIFSVTNDAPATFPVGNTIVTWTVTDVNGNTATCQQIVTVIDNQIPSIICPEPIVAYTDNGSCYNENITLITPTVSDNCSILFVAHDAPEIFPVGTTIVTWTVTDVNGNTATCQQTVTIIDNQLPNIICPEDIYACSETIELIEPQVIDNCGIESITNNAPNIFPVGTTIVTWTVTDVNGNVNICEQAIHVSLLEAFAEITSVPTCNGANDAEITITVSGNYGDLTYSIDGVNTQTYNIFSGLGSGTYYITTTDVTGCEVVYGPVEIHNPILLTATVNIVSDVLCYGSNEGAIEIFASGGTGEYTYYLNGSLIDQSSVSGLTAGEYSVLVIDSNNCETEVNGIIISQPQPLNVTYIATESVDCYGDNTASVEVFVSGGTGDYFVTLTSISSGNLHQSSTDYIFENLFAGTYTINVTDANNCSYQTEFAIGSPAAIVLDYNSYCEAGIVGVELHASGGNGNFLYSIDGGQNWSEDPHFSNLTNDTNIYLVVKDEKGCSSAIIEVPVVSLNTLNASVEIISPNSCYGVADAEIMINVEGGVMPYMFIINGQEVHYSNIISHINAGNYVIEIRDSNGCPANTEVTIESSEEIRIDLISKTDADCTGNANGAAQIDIHGGAGNFFYNWTNGATTHSVNNLAPGVHTVTVTDLKGCTVTYDVNIETDFIGEEIIVNNVFTPNNDGLNDYFTIKNIELYPENELVILNRWGNEVYTKTSYDNTWNGSDLTEGTYFYILKVKICNEEEIFKGYITILR